jgi:hypothetical protein
VENLKAFYIHLTVYVLVNIIIFGINLISDAGGIGGSYILLAVGELELQHMVYQPLPIVILGRIGKRGK